MLAIDRIKAMLHCGGDRQDKGDVALCWPYMDKSNVALYWRYRIKTMLCVVVSLLLLVLTNVDAHSL